MQEKEINLRIPAKDYGPIATAAALARKPIDKYVVRAITPATTTTSTTSEKP